MGQFGDQWAASVGMHDGLWAWTLDQTNKQSDLSYFFTIFYNISQLFNRPYNWDCW